MWNYCDARVDAGHVKSLHKRRDERANKHTDSATVNCVGTGNTALNFLCLLTFVFVRTLFIDSNLDSLQAFPDAEGATHVQALFRRFILADWGFRGMSEKYPYINIPEFAVVFPLERIGVEKKSGPCFRGSEISLIHFHALGVNYWRLCFVLFTAGVGGATHLYWALRPSVPTKAPVVCGWSMWHMKNTLVKSSRQWSAVCKLLLFKSWVHVVIDPENIWI